MATRHRGLRTWVLPPEYIPERQNLLTGAGMAVKIVHGRVPEEKRKNLHRYLNDNIKSFRSSSVFQLIKIKASLRSFPNGWAYLPLIYKIILINM